ncbi:MAG: hypothetical protein KF722_02200 [Nitrospira sp.]|nr:hypothetical protein [Nitrospira sp.]
MMNHNHTSIFPVVLGGVAVLSMVTLFAETASSKDGKKSRVHSSAEAATELVASTGNTVPRSTVDSSDRKPGPAWKTISGTITHIKGDVYTVEDYEGNRVQLYTNRETKQLRGSKKIGDRVRAEITHSGFANSIQ